MGNEETGTKCYRCQKYGKGPLISACECPGKVYHSECLKKWLNKEMSSSDTSVRSDDEVHHIECEGCNFEIKFKAIPKTRCRNKK